MRSKGRVIGVDLGSRRIGVAVSDSDRSLASGISTIHRSGDHVVDHAALAEVVEEYQAVLVVVGLPLSMSGGIGPAAAAVAVEVEQIRSRLGVDVETVDERLTTVVAAGALRKGGRKARQQRAVIDRTAAAVLLQTWLDRDNRQNGAVI